MNYKKYIRNVNDFPEKGIIFRDIGPLLLDARALRGAVAQLFQKIKGLKIDKVVGIDARGFILAGIIAYKLKAGLVMVRKAGKLPWNVETIETDIEYGKRILEIQKDSIKKSERVLVVDDVLATGGTVLSSIKLVEKLDGKVVGALFLISLDYLPGKQKLVDYKIYSLINYKK